MFKKFLKLLINIKTYIVIASAIAMGSNMFYLFVYGMRQHIHPIEWFEPGDQYKKFRPLLKDVASIGYLTDEQQNRETNDGFFLQAQYYLAPTIIQLNDHDNKYNIIDSENINYIRFVLASTNSKKITNNLYGQALIKRQ